MKTFQQSTSHPQLLRYCQSITQQQHIKKNGATETVSMKAEIKPSQVFNVKPVLSPHHPSLAGNHTLSPSDAHERMVTTRFTFSKGIRPFHVTLSKSFSSYQLCCFGDQLVLCLIMCQIYTMLSSR